jgi:predicted DnaQ family exonuclease/DinG family helicase
VDGDAIEALFAPGGPVPSRLSGYEERREQLDMMRAVGDAITSSTHLVVEAGTGVGKSLAYLVPAIHFAVANGARVVVSTNTKNLQEQLFYKDLPFLEQCLSFRFGAALLKGRGNYLCLERWRRLVERGLSPSERADLLPVVVWQEETASGDISENVAFKGLGYLWSRISADGPCQGSRCPSSDRCYLLKARRASQEAHVAVVNHSLLFSDTEADNRVLGEYSHLVCDEAHNLERVATEHLGKRANVWRARSVLDNLYRKDGADNGDLARLLEALDAAGEAGILSPVREAAERLALDVAQASQRADALFRALSARHGALAGGRSQDFGSIRHKADRPAGSLLDDVLPPCVAALRSVAEGAGALSDLLADSELPGADAHAQGLSFHAGRAGELAADLEYLAAAADAESVFWLDLRSGRDGPECEFRSAPVSVARAMADFLYARVDTLVMTSATLTVDGSFAFQMERLGLDLLPDSRVRTLDVGSPYDYDSQALAVVASYLPPPSSPGFNQKVSDLVVRLGSTAEGGTLVLFTSRSSLDAVFRAVRDPLTARGRLVLGQGHGPGATALLEQFARDERSVLLATASFWEGVDVPGRSLEQLVIVKLPFPVPSDPIVEAHCERYEAEGEDSFNRYMVPRTAIRLKQGFGRLIRSSTDTGVVVFLDSRLATKSYGPRLLDELPTRVELAESERELLASVERMHRERVAAGR